jgi:hypothetical protein
LAEAITYCKDTWVDDIRLGRIASFGEIAKREGQGERHIRLLAPLAFVSRRIIAAIVDGSAPADLTVTGLASLIAGTASSPSSLAAWKRPCPASEPGVHLSFCTGLSRGC